MTDGAATSHLLQPKIIAALRDGYDLDTLRRDAVAGLTVAIVALPLSMAIAVASGVSPERGLFTAIVGGFVVSALSGSRYQIGGPAGAFIVLVAAAVVQLGVSGVLLAVLISGVLLTLLALFRVGALVRHIPHAVTVGFTAGIAVTIAVSQLRDFVGIRLPGHEPGSLVPRLLTLIQALPAANLWALAIGVMTTALILVLRRVRPAWPGMLVGVTLSSLLAQLCHLPVDTIASRFGDIPHGLPAPAVPAFSFQLVAAVFPTALSFTLLGAVESLLSAKVADGMTGRKHRSNMELLGQGFANIASALFGGICVTGTIARTATNIRAGARTPISGMLHAVFLLLFMLVAAPLAGFIPLAALAGVLLVVSWTMAEKAEFLRLLRTWPGTLVLLSTFLGTLLRDLTVGILLGCAVAFVLTLLKTGIVEEGP
ncbi:MAG: SulP family inorganic anion transporter [Terricaulis sp.]